MKPASCAAKAKVRAGARLDGIVAQVGFADELGKEHDDGIEALGLFPEVHEGKAQLRVVARTNAQNVAGERAFGTDRGPSPRESR